MQTVDLGGPLRTAFLKSLPNGPLFSKVYRTQPSARLSLNRIRLRPRARLGGPKIRAINHPRKGGRTLFRETSVPDHKKKGLAPFSLRLSKDERELLERRAAGKPLGRYIRTVIFHSDNGAGEVPPTRKDIAQLSGKLGQSGLVKSLTQLAEAARIGALPLTPETEAAIQTAAADIQTMK